MLKTKKLWISLLIAVMTFTTLFAGCSTDTGKDTSTGTRTITDMAGTDVELPETINSVADFWHANNQTVLTLGGADKLVATTTNIKKMPWFAKVYPRINDVPALISGNGNDIQMEELLNLNPDIVLSSSKDQVQNVRDAGLKAFYVSFTDFDGLKECTRLTGQVLGKDEEEKAEKYIEYLDKNIKLVEDHLKDVPQESRPKILHLVNGTDLTKVDGTNTIIDEWMKLGGGQNALTQEGNQINVTMEEIVNANPDIIIVGSSDSDKGVATINTDPAWASINAVKNGKVLQNPQGTFPWDRYSSEEALQVLWIAKNLYPDKFQDVDVVAETQKFYKDFLNYDLSKEDAELILAAKNPS